MPFSVLNTLNRIAVALGGVGTGQDKIQALDNILAAIIALILTLPTSGTYQPVATLTTNIAAITPFLAQFIRVGSVVTVSGLISVTFTAAAPTASTFELSLPVPSNIGAITDLAGAFTSDPSGVTPDNLTGNIANNTANFNMGAVAVGPDLISYTFTYRII